MGVGARITELRLRKKESLQDVADAVGVSKAHIWELEKGRSANPSMGLVTRLAEHFGVSLAFLVGEDPKAKDADGKVARLFRQVSHLPAEDVDLLDDMVKSMLKRQRKGDAGEP